jgi:DNA-binding response OmpR family regulator
MSETVPESPASRILLCVPDHGLCEFTRTALEEDGHAVAVLGDPSLAEGELRGGNYDLFILDHIMPQMSGPEVLLHVRKVDTDLPALMFTASQAGELSILALQLEKVEALRKPITGEKLGAAIDRLLLRPGARTPEQQVHRALGDNIRKERKRQGLTLKQVARRTDIGVELLSQIERAETSASIAALYKIATALESKITDLLGDV